MALHPIAVICDYRMALGKPHLPLTHALLHLVSSCTMCYGFACIDATWCHVVLFAWVFWLVEGYLVVPSVAYSLCSGSTWRLLACDGL